MKSQPVTIFELDLAEAHHFHEILCITPKLSEAATALHDAVRDGLKAAKQYDGIIDVEITLGLEVLEEITPLFATRSHDKDIEAGLDATIGYNIADVLLEALAPMRRLSIPLTQAERENFVFTPTTARKTGILRKLFGTRNGDVN
jgi:hypothetical protein